MELQQGIRRVSTKIYILKLSTPQQNNKQTLNSQQNNTKTLHTPQQNNKQTLNPLTVESLDQVFEGYDLGLHARLSQCVVVLYAFKQMLQAPETVGLDEL